MKYRYNATGSDIIPNKAFWIMLPGLIKVWLAYNILLIAVFHAINSAGWLCFHIWSNRWILPGKSQSEQRL